MVPTCSTVITPTTQNFRLNFFEEPTKAETPVRVSLACMNCRSRKVRCNGESPCSSCLSSSRQCFFDRAKGKRRRKSQTILHIPIPKHINHEQATVTLEPGKKKGALEKITITNSTGLPQPEYNSSSQLPNPTRIPYFRFLGPTAIAPGAPFREISLKLVRDSCSRVPHTRRPIDLDSVSPTTIQTEDNQLSGALPVHIGDHSHAGSSLSLTDEEFLRNVDIFYDYMGSYLACIKKQDFLQSLSQGKASEALKLAICALAECIQPSSSVVDHAEIWSSRAKSLCVPHLSLPSLDTTFTLLLLAYCEFGREKDSGLWMWSGLAFRMATDLGLYKSSGVHGNKESSAWDESESGLRQRIFWCCYHLDRLISSGTGRVATLLDSEIEINLPDVLSIHCDQAISGGTEELLSPFHHLTQILILVGKISDTFNRKKIGSFSEPESKTLEQFRTELLKFYNGLPPILHFAVDNARRYISLKNGPAFMLLHVWFHSLVIITHNPNSVGPGWASRDFGPIEPTLLEISQGSARTISDMIAFANLVDPGLVLSIPFASQPILLAGLASIPTRSQSQNPSDGLGQTPDWRDFNICSAALTYMQTRWRGVSWLVSTLHSRARNEQDVDLSTSGGAEVCTCDNSLMNKLVKGREAQLLNSEHWTKPNQSNKYFVGLSATGTFHEPASGRLSLVHQPDLGLMEPASASKIFGLKNKHEEQKWNMTPAGQPGKTVARAPDRSHMHAQVEETGTAAGDKFCPHPAGYGIESIESTEKFDEGHPLLDPPSSWATESIPQSSWPNLPGLNVFNRPPQSCSESLSSYDPAIGLQVLDIQTHPPAAPIATKNYDSFSNQVPSPFLDNKVWEELFRGEVGICSSFHQT